MDLNNKRQSERKIINNDVYIHLRLVRHVLKLLWNGDQCIPCDISTGGLGFYSNEPIPENGQISANIRLGKSAKNIIVLGRIIWVNKQSNSKYRAGIEFFWWRDYLDRSTIQDFCNPQNWTI